jgi:dTDP-glucose 4,6-dehydratase
MWLLESFAHANDALALGMRAVVLTRDPAAFAQKAPHLTRRADLQFVPGEVQGFTFPVGKFPFVIHAATDTRLPVLGTDPRWMRDGIVGGTRRVLDFAAQAGTRKMLFTSSGAVNGPQPSSLTHLPEDYAGRPGPLATETAYALGKRLSEELCLARVSASGFECKIARCFAFVGPHLPLGAHFAIGNFIRDALRGESIQVSGDGTPCRSYLYAADLAVWLWTILFRGISGRTYNVGSAAGLPLAVVAQTVGRVSGEKIAVNIARAPVAGHAPARYVPSVERARCELGLEQRMDLETAVQRTADWLRLGPVQ